MKHLAKLILAGLRYYWRTHLGVLLGTAVATAVLVGALTVGDSVRDTLAWQAKARLGRTQVAVISAERFFRTQLAEEIETSLLTGRHGSYKATASAVLLLPASARKAGAGLAVPRVQALGVDETFWALAGAGGKAPPAFAKLKITDCLVNAALAEKFQLRLGDVILVKPANPGLLSREAPLSGQSRGSTSVRATVRGVVGDDQFGRFALQSKAAAPYNVFMTNRGLGRLVDLGTLNESNRPATLAGRANTLLLAADQGERLNVAAVQDALDRSWRLEDAGLNVRFLRPQGAHELRTARVFLDEAVARAVTTEDAWGVLTYLVSEIRCRGRTTPYSMVTAAGPLAPAKTTATSRPRRGPGTLLGAIPPDMKDNEIVLTSWLRKDLQAEVGDEVTLRYPVLRSGRKLDWAERTFRVRSVVELTPDTKDPALMPDFPDLANTTSCSNWKPGIKIDRDKIHSEDEKYWEDYRGTPKALVTLRAGQKMWANRYGSLTAIRYPVRGPVRRPLAEVLRSRLTARDVGLAGQDVAARAERAAKQAIDFAPLFLGLSMFLIAAAVLLVALLYAFGIQHRSREIGTLLAVGFTPWRVRTLLLAETLCLALAGAVVGVPLGLAYTGGVLWALGSVWQGAVGSTALRFDATGASIGIALAAGVLAAAGSAAWILFRTGKRSTSDLLAGAAVDQASGRSRAGRRKALWLAGVAGAGAVGAVVAGWLGGQEASVGAFFGAGALLLVATLSLARHVLGLWVGRRRHALSLGRLAGQNAARRAGRSLAVMALLACGVFMVVAVAANRKQGTPDPTKADSPTGGFALYADTSVGVLGDLSSPAGQEALHLSKADTAGVTIVPGRRREGDEASCLNLNQPQQPKLLGLPAKVLAKRGSFRTVSALADPKPDQPWALLADDNPADRVVPALTDQGTLQWSLKRTLGDELEYLDEWGRPFRVRLVATIENSILQGSVVIDESAFRRMYPSEAGYRVFLIDAPAARVAAVETALSNALEPYGFDSQPAVKRLEAFQAVENTYLAIFQVLGGLGLLLGSAGLGLLVLRNVLERRGELALLRAVGFPAGRLGWLVLAEHAGLLLAGVTCGVVSAVVAVLPAVWSAGSSVPVLGLTVTVAAVAAAGVACTVVATRSAMRGQLLAALRSE